MDTEIKAKFRSALFSALILGAISIQTICVYAADDSDKTTCLLDSETARLACATPDTTAGTTDNGAQMKALVATITTKNSQTAALGSEQAAQCANQNEISQQLAKLSDLKAQACKKTSTSCQTSCARSAKFHQGLADLYKILDLGAKSKTETTNANIITAMNQVCIGYSANISMATLQATSLLQNAGISQSCFSGTTAGAASTGETSAATALGAGGKGASFNIGSVKLGGADGSASSGALGKTTLGNPAAKSGAASTVGTTKLGQATNGGLGDAQMARAAQDAERAAMEKNVLAMGSSKIGENQGGASGASTQSKDANPELSEAAIHDGVTSAMGLSLWEKVSRRYLARKKDLILTDN